MGTPNRPSLDGAILCLEEIGEELQDVNMILAQLRNAGVLGQAKGIVLGHLEGMKKKRKAHCKRLSSREVREGPVLKTKAFGHFRPCFTLPLGVTGALDAAAQTLVIEESR